MYLVDSPSFMVFHQRDFSSAKSSAMFQLLYSCFGDGGDGLISCPHCSVAVELLIRSEGCRREHVVQRREHVRRGGDQVGVGFLLRRAEVAVADLFDDRNYGFPVMTKD